MLDLQPAPPPAQLRGGTLENPGTASPQAGKRWEGGHSWGVGLLTAEPLQMMRRAPCSCPHCSVLKTQKNRAGRLRLSLSSSVPMPPPAVFSMAVFLQGQSAYVCWMRGCFPRPSVAGGCPHSQTSVSDVLGQEKCPWPKPCGVSHSPCSGTAQSWWTTGTGAQKAAPLPQDMTTALPSAARLLPINPVGQARDRLLQTPHPCSASPHFLPCHPSLSLPLTDWLVDFKKQKQYSFIKSKIPVSISAS